MAYTIVQIENAILETLQADNALSGYVRLFTPIPSLDEEALKKLLIVQPAIGVISPHGDYKQTYSKVEPQPREETGIFTVLCFNSNLRSQVAAIRGGTPGEKGLWDMVEDARRVVLAGLRRTVSGAIEELAVTQIKAIRRSLLHAGESSAIGSLELEIRYPIA